jgi:hypothetical protein
MEHLNTLEKEFVVIAMVNIALVRSKARKACLIETCDDGFSIRGMEMLKRECVKKGCDMTLDPLSLPAYPRYLVTLPGVKINIKDHADMGRLLGMTFLGDFGNSFIKRHGFHVHVAFEDGYSLPKSVSIFSEVSLWPETSRIGVKDMVARFQKCLPRFLGARCTFSMRECIDDGIFKRWDMQDDESYVTQNRDNYVNDLVNYCDDYSIDEIEEFGDVDMLQTWRKMARDMMDL